MPCDGTFSYGAVESQSSNEVTLNFLPNLFINAKLNSKECFWPQVFIKIRLIAESMGLLTTRESARKKCVKDHGKLNRVNYFTCT